MKMNDKMYCVPMEKGIPPLFIYKHVDVLSAVQVLACYLLRHPLYTFVYPRIADCAASISTQVISTIKTYSLDSWYNERSAV